ncbi:MAG: ABC transporter six-transmembrane domain-containing protein [Verrucomicrobiota bacterium]
MLGRFRGRIAITWAMVAAEGVLFVLFPYFIGRAVDDFMKNSWFGLLMLAGLGIGMLVIGAARRFYDSRIYAKIYREIAPELVRKERERSSSVSTISARTGLAAELVEYLEDSIPMIFTAVLGLLGSLVIIAFLSLNVFLVCLLATAGIAFIFWLSRRSTFRFNQGYNEELEDRVRVIEAENDGAIASHFQNLMRWNIRLSDLETKNFSFSWILLMGVIVFAVIEPIRSGNVSQGMILSLLMYVFNYIESVLGIPLHYQRFVRLQEISARLSGAADPADLTGVSTVTA